MMQKYEAATPKAGGGRSHQASNYLSEGQFRQKIWSCEVALALRVLCPSVTKSHTANTSQPTFRENFEDCAAKSFQNIVMAFGMFLSFLLLAIL
jgi:hypothetical protein